MRRIRSERGYTIVECLIVAALLSVVLAGTVSLLDKTVELFPADQERAHALRDAQVGLHAMTRELRQAYDVVSPAVGQTAGAVTVDVTVRSVDYRVTWNCAVAWTGAGDQCIRTSHRLVGGTPAGAPSVRQEVVTRVQNGATVFTRETESFMKARIEIPSKGDRSDAAIRKVVLDDGFFLRNVATG